MPTKIMKVSPVPFVKYNFRCETHAEKIRKKRVAREYLRAYLQGYAIALKSAGVGTFQYVFKDNFLPKRRGSKDFIYTAIVKRKSRKVPNPDSTVNPPPVKSPNP